MSVAPPALGHPNAQGCTFDINGVIQGFVQSVEGGSAIAEVVVEQAGPDYIAHKHLAGLKYQDITVAVGTGMGKDLYEHVKATFDRNFSTQNISFRRFDVNQNVTSGLWAVDTLLTAVGFPELNVSSKDVGMLTLKFLPERTDLKYENGKVGQVLGNKAKQWFTSNFRLTIPGLDCTRVSKIGALDFTVDVVSKMVGMQRFPQVTPTGVTVPNLVVTLSEQTALAFIQWQVRFAIIGENGQDQEKEGTLEILAADLKEVLFTLKFHGLGIFRLTPDKYEARSEQVHTVTAVMYCESMEIGYGPGAVGS